MRPSASFAVNRPTTGHPLSVVITYLTLPKGFHFTSDFFAAMTDETDNRDPQRLTAALWLVVRRYCSQIRRHPALAIPALVLPGLGQILIFYSPPLIIAGVLGKFASDTKPSLRELMPY